MKPSPAKKLSYSTSLIASGWAFTHSLGFWLNSSVHKIMMCTFEALFQCSIHIWAWV